MASSAGPNWPIGRSMDDQEFAAAESMVQHSRSARSHSQAFNGFSLPDVQNYPLPSTQAPPPINHMAGLPPLSYPPYRHPYAHATAQDQPQTLGAPFDGKLPSPHQLYNQFDPHGKDSFSDLSQPRNPDASGQAHLSGHSTHPHRDNGSIDGSEPTSPVSVRGFNRRQLDEAGNWTHRLSNDAVPGQQETKDESDKKPAWSELKTKAGKERKRLPLACIACRRKKIRCSGEKPSCKHCMRSRIPCVYKVTQRKAAPRTDYMAMLDKRLKRMEERVIKIIPKDETERSSAIPRAIIKPSTSAQVSTGKKRGAEEAFGPQLDEWAESKANPTPLRGSDGAGNQVNTEGAKYLPSLELQEHLSEVFFDYLYGQTYHLLHKPSYMRNLKAGTVPPVLVLAVCATSARFSTHPLITGEPFLRGEEWASRAREISLRRYDEPNVTTLTVYVLLGLHEFGTCQGGRSWMFAGMATRMAYALQLHRELVHDPVDRQHDKKSEFSATEREIRRRAMWSCFLMDRFNSSGTERPMFADEETIKVQLPIKESNFQMEIPGPTDGLNGRTPNPVIKEPDQSCDPKANIGVAALMIQVIALWGKVIKYLNMGGREQDRLPVWDSESGFAKLRREADDFKNSFSEEMTNTPENLKTHAAEKLGNQFVFLHIASNMVILFLNRFAIPTRPGARPSKEIPKLFVNEAGPLAIKAAEQISNLIGKAWEYRAVAPFLGYCTFMSSTIHVFAMFSNKRTAETSKAHLKTNIDYLQKMKNYWGMFHFMTENLKEIYRQNLDASTKEKDSGEAATKDDTVFQYGDWFQKYPHGVSKTDYLDPAVQVKEEAEGNAASSHNSGLQSVEEFFNARSPESHTKDHRKCAKKSARSTSQPNDRHGQPQQSEVQKETASQGMMPLAMPEPPHSLDPSAFATPQESHLYPQPCLSTYPQGYDLLPLSTPSNTSLLPQLDRQLVYGAYAGHDPTASTSASALNAMTHGQPDPSSALSEPGSQMWDNPLGLSAQEQQMMSSGVYMGDMQTSAWFMPFNLHPPSIGGEDEDFSKGLGAFGGTSG